MNTLITTQHKKGRHWLDNLCAVTYNKAQLDEERAQLLNENGGEFQSDLLGIIRKHSTPNQFADEEVESDWTYPPEYRVLPIEEQIAALAKIFGLSPDDALAYAKQIVSKPLTEGAEGRFAVISDAGLTKLLPNVTDPEERFCLGVNLVLEKIASTRTFYNYRQGELTKDRLRRHAKTVAACEKLAAEQKGGIWIIDAQLGFRHRGKSVRRARVCFAGNEYGLDPIAKGSIILTHPNRFVRWEQLHADCAGAEFRPDADGVFSGAPDFGWVDGGLKFGTFDVAYASGFYGSTSGFLPQ